MASELDLLQEEVDSIHPQRWVKCMMGAIDVLFNYQPHFVKDCAHGFCTCPDTPFVPCDECYIHDGLLRESMHQARTRRERTLNNAFTVVEAYYRCEAFNADIGKICVARHIGPELAQVVHAFLDEGMERKRHEALTFYNEELVMDAVVRRHMQAISGDPTIQITFASLPQTTAELRAQYRETNSGPPPNDGRQ